MSDKNKAVVAETAPKPKVRETDSEILLLGRLDRTLSNLDPEARERVLTWLASKFGYTIQSVKIERIREQGEAACRALGFSETQK